MFHMPAIETLIAVRYHVHVHVPYFNLNTCTVHVPYRSWVIGKYKVPSTAIWLGAHLNYRTSYHGSAIIKSNYKVQYMYM